MRIGVPRGAGNGQAATIAIVSGPEALTDLCRKRAANTVEWCADERPRKEDTTGAPPGTPAPRDHAPGGALRKPCRYLHFIGVP